MSDFREELRIKVADLLGVSLARLEDGTPLKRLVTESILLVEMILELEAIYGIKTSQESLTSAVTVGRLLDVLSERVASKSGARFV